jgi:hypothetical protein
VTLSSPRGRRLLYFSGTVKLLLSPGKAGGLPKGNYAVRRNCHFPWYPIVAAAGKKGYAVVRNAGALPGYPFFKPGETTDSPLNHKY